MRPILGRAAGGNPLSTSEIIEGDVGVYRFQNLFGVAKIRVCLRPIPAFRRLTAPSGQKQTSTGRKRTRKSGSEQKDEIAPMAAMPASSVQNAAGDIFSYQLPTQPIRILAMNRVR